MSKQVVPVFEQDVVVVSLDRETFSIQIGAPRRQQRTPEETQIWDSMCAQNPRLFDGPILAVERVDWNASSGEACVHALVGRYSSLCLARAQVNTRSSTFEQPACAILSVTGLLTKQRVCSGRQEVLMGLRGSNVASYPLHWEFAPAGGLGVPNEGTSSVTPSAMRDALIEEYVEEIGSPSQQAIEALRDSELVALVFDRTALSYDIVLRVQLPENELDDHPLLSLDVPDRSWEYAALQWIPTSDLVAFFSSDRHQIIPPARLLAKALGWIP